MALDLSTYRAVQTVNFVKIVIDGSPTILLNDGTVSYTIGADTYSNINQLLYVGESSSEIGTLEQQLTVGIFGVLSTTVNDIITTDLKGSLIEVRQGFYNPQTGVLLAIGGNPLTKFKGLITNYSITEQWDNATKTSNWLVVLQCNSLVTTILEKVSGRRTNDADQQILYPGDLSMSRVSTITRAQFQFGKPGGAAP